MNRSRMSFKMLLVMACSLILAVAMTGSAAAETDVYLGVAFHPFTLDGGNDTCVDYNDADIGPTKNCDPVNLVFPGRSWMEVRDLLMTDDWDTGGAGSDQWLHYDGTQLYMQNVQLYKQATLFSPRYHIRLWQAPGDILVTFAAVHHEDWLHTIDMDWEEAEAYVAAALCDPDCDQTGPLATQIGIQRDEGDAGTWRTNAAGTRRWINDGSATAIPAPGPPDDPPEVTIFLPAVGSTVSGLTPVQIQAVDGDDPAGTLDVEWRIDGGWLPATYNPASDYYEASWDTTAVTDGDHLFYAQATDSAQDTAGTGHTVTVDNPNLPPVAVFSFNCNGLSCDFDAAGSYDPDGAIVDYDWDFSDSTSGSAVTVAHTYAGSGTYAVTLTVTDDQGATGSDSQAVTVVGTPATTMHVGDLEGAAIVKKNWSAQVTITVHDAGEGLVPGATVSGDWSGDASGSGICTTDGSGACTVSSAELSKKTAQQVIFTVTDIDHPSLTYDAAANHDPQGNSSGSAVQVYKDGTTQDPGGSQAGELTLTAVGYKVRGVHRVDLTWSGATLAQGDIYRDGDWIVTWPSGSVPYTDTTGQKGGASYLYQVCEQGTAVCSEVVTVTF